MRSSASGIMREGKLVAVGVPSALKREVDRKLRLELFFRPSSPPRLPDDLEVRELQPGRWITWIDRGDASAVLDRLDLRAVGGLPPLLSHAGGSLYALHGGER